MPTGDARGHNAYLTAMHQFGKDTKLVMGSTRMSIRVTLLWGDDIISTEALQRAESRALEIINQAGTTPEESKRGFDLWKQRKRGEALPAAEIKHLYDVWVNADHAAEAVLEEGLTDRKLVCAELELNGHD